MLFGVLYDSYKFFPKIVQTKMHIHQPDPNSVVFTHTHSLLFSKTS